ncbi:MAG: hypothetical protein QNL57_03880, partial [Alphaproteobacteria bacterium]
MPAKTPDYILHSKVAAVLERIRKRSATSRAAYLEQLQIMEDDPDSDRGFVSCSNIAHAAAVAGSDQS